MAENKNNTAASEDIVRVDFTQPEKKMKKDSLIARIVYAGIALIVGIIFILARNGIFDMLGYIVGGILLIMGAVTITAFLTAKGNKWVGSLVWGILLVLIGIYCLFNPAWIANAAVYIFAVIIFISGIVMAYFAVRDKKAGFKQWLPSLIFGIALAVLGLVMLLFVRQTQAVVAVITGVSFILTAILNVVSLILK